MNAIVFVAVLALFPPTPVPPAPPAAPAPRAVAPRAVAIAPPPRDEGSTRPAPAFLPRPSGQRPEVLAAWVRNLGGDEFEAREAAESGLSRSGWDGYVACRAVASSSDCPEVRARAGRVCHRYLSPPMSAKPCGIYRLNGSYTAWVVTPGQYYHTEVTLGDPPTVPDVRAVLSHWYMLRAVRAEWEAELRAGGSAQWGRNDNGQGPVFYKYRTVWCEELATRMMARDLLAYGVSREWVAWLIDDMTRRKCVYPTVITDPPWWLTQAMGFLPNR